MGTSPLMLFGGRDSVVRPWDDLIATPQFFTHFFGTETSSAASATAGALQVTTVGGGVTAVLDCDAPRYGQVQLSNGTSVTGRTAIHAPQGSIKPGQGRVIEYVSGVRPTVLSNGTNRYVTLAGFINGGSGVPTMNSIAAIYDEGGVSTGTASPNWQFVTRGSGTPTYTVTDVPVSISDWADIKIVVNADATKADLYIGGSLVASHTDGIPVGTNITGPGIGTYRVLAGTAATLPIHADYLGWSC